MRKVKGCVAMGKGKVEEKEHIVSENVNRVLFRIHDSRNSFNDNSLYNNFGNHKSTMVDGVM